MIEFNNLTIRMNANLLIEDFSFKITPRMRIGLIGKNGSGKTTLFNTILGRHEIDKGEIHIPKNCVTADVAQEITATSFSAFEYILSGDEELISLREAEIEALKIEDGLKISEIHQRLEQIDGYRADSRAYQLLSGLGFREDEYHHPVNHFSGGWRMRLNIGKALMCRSDILLLDEPTNHLDFETVIWVEDWLKSYKGMLIIISHDHEFLDNICNHIIHLYQKRAEVYTGNYSDFLKLKSEKLVHQKALYEKTERTRAHLQKFINRFGAKATKAKQAQSRVKALERLENIAPVIAENEFQFSFFKPERLPDPLIRLDQVSFSYDETTQNLILKEIDLTITPDSRFGLLGRNGEGKSTLIKLLTRELTPSSGMIISSEYLNVGYFSQHQIEYLELDETPLWHIQKLDSSLTTQSTRNFLGAFGFHGEKVDEIIKPFSGGEKARLALAIIVFQKPNLLLLDEPTNHLDMEMREAIAIALQSYEGALVMVSHDASLLKLCCDEFMLVANKKITPFKGDLDDYRTYLAELNKESQEKNKSPQDIKDSHSIKGREERKRLNIELRRMAKERDNTELKIQKLEKKITKINLILSDSNTYKTLSFEEIEKLNQEKEELMIEKEFLEELWLSHSERIEKIKKFL